MITIEIQKQFSDIFEELGKSLDITENQFNKAVESYQAVGEYLASEDSTLSNYSPDIIPQGSFMLGTMIRPINPEDDIDIDLVCRLEGKKKDWTQFDLKQKVGDRLKQNLIFEKLLEKEGRRCWTLKYSDSRKFHMDILPALVSKEYKIILEKAFREADIEKVDDLSIRITDKEEDNYYTSSIPEEWLKSNPFGYARWFHYQANIDITKANLIVEAIKPVREYTREKLPLQRVVQLLKRHRDIMFNGDEDKPISIIITTLTTKGYKKQTSLLEALVDIVNNLPKLIEERYSEEYKRIIKWIPNPVNDEENFADKWPESPKKEENFYKWHAKLKSDIQLILGKAGYGIDEVQKSLIIPFGENVVNDAFNNLGDRARILRESRRMRMAEVTGILGTEGRTSVPNHQNYGANEKNLFT